MTKTADTLPEQAVLAEIASAIADESGWAVHLLPQRALRRAVNRRMSATDRKTIAAYLLHLRRQQDERTALLGEVLIHETSFFRDMAVFDHLLTWCREWLQTHTGTLRILSGPCSTGEEAYSVAAQLWRAGVPLDRFRIDAIDIAPDAVAAASHGVYRGLSLRSVPNPEQEAFLEAFDGGWRVIAELRARVSARVGNLVSPHLLRGTDDEPPYDLILSRNLLMYLHTGARASLIRNLHEALTPEGRLVLGAADWAPDLSAWFALERPFVCFAARPVSRSTAAAQGALKQRGLNPIATAEDVSKRQDLTPTAAGKGVLKGRDFSPAVNFRQSAVASATEGRPAKARKPSEEQAPHEPGEAATLYREALRARRTGLPHEAVRKSRQALYLEPTHVPAMELLYQVWEQAPARVREALAKRLARHQPLKEENA